MKIHCKENKLKKTIILIWSFWMKCDKVICWMSPNIFFPISVLFVYSLGIRLSWSRFSCKLSIRQSIQSYSLSNRYIRIIYGSLYTVNLFWGFVYLNLCSSVTKIVLIYFLQQSTNKHTIVKSLLSHTNIHARSLVLWHWPRYDKV